MIFKRDYAHSYKTWIKDTTKSLYAVEMRKQDKIYKYLSKYKEDMNRQFIKAQHDLNIAQRMVQMQARLMREL